MRHRLQWFIHLPAHELDREMSSGPTVLAGYDSTLHRYVARSSRERLYCAMCMFYYTRQPDGDVSDPTTDSTEPTTEAGLCNVPTSHRDALHLC